MEIFVKNQKMCQKSKSVPRTKFFTKIDFFTKIEFFLKNRKQFLKISKCSKIAFFSNFNFLLYSSNKNQLLNKASLQTEFHFVLIYFFGLGPYKRTNNVLNFLTKSIFSLSLFRKSLIRHFSSGIIELKIVDRFIF